MARFFHPMLDWSWYIIEYDGNDTCWGLVDGFEAEFGYFSIKELSQRVGKLRLSAELDGCFKPTKIRDITTFTNNRVTY